MKLKEYMELTGKKALNSADIQLFNVPDLKKGWKRRYKNLEAPDELVNECLRNITSKYARRLAKNIRSKQAELRSPSRSEGKKLYLFVNLNGLLKIGVSKDPIQRARYLSSASGVLISVMGIWDSEDAFTCEKILHNHFKNQRLLGEWFLKDSTTVEEISNILNTKATLIDDFTQNKSKFFK